VVVIFILSELGSPFNLRERKLHLNEWRVHHKKLAELAVEALELAGTAFFGDVEDEKKTRDAF